jgi:GT2 family glycosyltransferase
MSAGAPRDDRARPRLSVVVPTRGRRAKLARVLDALAAQAQEVGGALETLAVDDGSEDDTRAFLASRPADPARLTALSQEHAGPAAARNRGAAAARGERLVFLGDDTVPQPGFLATHAAPPERDGPVAVLGYTTWDRVRMRVTPFLVHLNERGPQFGYGLLTDPEAVPFSFFYTSNVSLPRETFHALAGFDASFSSAAFEDVELAYRATRASPPLSIVYRPAARALHEHPTTLHAVLRRERIKGGAAARFARKHPELAGWLGADRARRLPRTRPASLEWIERTLRLLDPLGLPLPARAYDKLLAWPYLDALRRELGSASEKADEIAFPRRQSDCIP